MRNEPEIENVRERINDLKGRLLDHIRGAGHPVEELNGYAIENVRVDGEHVSIVVNPERDWSRKLTGKIRVSIGGYGDTRNFPEPKAGFNLEKLAAAVYSNVESARELRLSRASADAKCVRRNALAEALPKTSTGISLAARGDSDDYNMTFSNVSEDTVRKLAEYLKAMETNS